MTYAPRSDFDSKILRPILADLFAKDSQVLRRDLEELIDANHQAGNPKEGFLLNGEFHTLMNSKSIPLENKRQIHVSLYGQTMAYIRQRDTCNKEKSRMTFGLVVLLTDCKTWQDIRDALPEILVKMVPGLTELKRTRQEAWTLEFKPLQQHQYQEIRDLIDFYFTNKLLY